MEKFKIKIINGLKKLHDLEKKYNMVSHDDSQNHDDDIGSINDDVILLIDDDPFDKNQVNIEFLNTNVKKIICHNDMVKTTNNSEINLIDDDPFDKKYTAIEFQNNTDNLSIINYFPNALLLQESIFNIESDNSDKTALDKPATTNAKKNAPADIWQILKEINAQNNSEAIDILTTETESDIMSLNNQLSANQSLADQSCRGCGSKGSLIEDQSASSIICASCGMINEELLDHGPEWRQYNNDDNRGEGVNRCGCPTNVNFPKSSQGTIIAGSSNSRLKRKQKWNSMVYKERSLNQVFEYIAQICNNNDIPKIITDLAQYFYKKLSDCKHESGLNTGKQIIIRGENRISIIAACLFKACEMKQNPRNTREIADYFELDEKKVTKGIKQYDKIIKNSDDKTTIIEQETDIAEDYIKRHCINPKLKVNRENMQLAMRIANNCYRMKLASDHNPESVAAGSILLMAECAHLNIDKKKISNLFGTSDVTICKIYNKIIPYIDALVNDDATEHLIAKFKING